MFFLKRAIQRRPVQQDLDFSSTRKYFWQKELTGLKKITWIAALLCIGLSALLIAQLARAQNTELSSLNSLNEAEAGQLVFETSQGGFQQAVHLNSHVDVQINGMIAKVVYKQVFKNDSRDWREAVYVFPLSENAAVNEMEIRLGERIIRAEIKEKAEARQIYEQAKSAGQVAALTEQQRPNLFTQSIANIAPGEQIEISLSFVQPVAYDSGTFSFYLPTTLTPRFMPAVPFSISEAELEEEQSFTTTSAFGWAMATTQVPDAHLISPFMVPVAPQGTEIESQVINLIEINVELQAGLVLSKITSRNHDIDLSNENGIEYVSLDAPTSMDRDFWLEWSPIPSAQPEAAVFQERIDGQDYALLMLLPPQIQTSEEHDLPREVVFIIDTSSSMNGGSIEQAKASLILGLDRLDNRDRFNVIEFNSYHRSFHPAPVQASGANLIRAKNSVYGLKATGGTNMLPALAQALTTPGTEGYLKQVIFITDGAIGNEAQLFDLIHRELADARLFTVGIGSAPNSHFMSRAAQFGRGTFEYISNQTEITARMSNLFRKLESSVLSDLHIEWPASVAGLEQFPVRMPDLYSGEPLVLSVRASELNGQVKINGTTAEAPWTRTLNLQNPLALAAQAASGPPETSIEIDNPNSADEPAKGIATIWARKKIASLMDEMTRGRTEVEVRQEILNVAIPHKLISKYTSLVAVEEVVVRPTSAPLKPGVVPNAVAAGQNLQPQTYPRTATWLPFNLLMANLSLLGLLALYRNQVLQLLMRFRSHRC